MSWLDPQEQHSSGAPGPALPDPWLDDQGGSEAAGSPASITSSTDSTSWSDGFDEIGGADFADFAGVDLNQPQPDAYGASGARPGPLGGEGSYTPPINTVDTQPFLPNPAAKLGVRKPVIATAPARAAPAFVPGAARAAEPEASWHAAPHGRTGRGRGGSRGRGGRARRGGRRAGRAEPGRAAADMLAAQTSKTSESSAPAIAGRWQAAGNTGAGAAEASPLAAEVLAKAMKDELELADIVAIWRSAASIGLPTRPRAVVPGLGLLFVELEDKPRRQRADDEDAEGQWDTWINTGGKNGLKVDPVPRALTGPGEQLTVARRRGKVRRDNLEMSYLQFNIAVTTTKKGGSLVAPGGREGPTIYHILPGISTPAQASAGRKQGQKQARRGSKANAAAKRRKKPAEQLAASRDDGQASSEPWRTEAEAGPTPPWLPPDIAAAGLGAAGFSTAANPVSAAGDPYGVVSPPLPSPRRFARGGWILTRAILSRSLNSISTLCFAASKK